MKAWKWTSCQNFAREEIGALSKCHQADFITNLHISSTVVSSDLWEEETSNAGCLTPCPLLTQCNAPGADRWSPSTGSSFHRKQNLEEPNLEVSEARAQCVGPRCRMSIGCTTPRLGSILIPFNPCKVLSDTSPNSKGEKRIFLIEDTFSWGYFSLIGPFPKMRRLSLAPQVL